ncbi:5-dehydro-4-deoxyglucarate dehydratase, partial [Massilia sp. CT11-137]
GARLVGHDGGPVRAPLTDLTAEESDMLHKLIVAQGGQ